MRVTITSTEKIVELKTSLKGEPFPARLWEGVTDSGVKVHLYVTRIAAKEDQDLTEFEKELQSHQAPSADIVAIPLRMII